MFNIYVQAGKYIITFDFTAFLRLVGKSNLSNVIRVFPLLPDIVFSFSLNKKNYSRTTIHAKVTVGRKGLLLIVNIILT